MAFNLVREQDVPKSNGTYTVRLLFDADTNTLRNEYWIEGGILYFIEYEGGQPVDSELDAVFAFVVDAFHSWYEFVGPDWRSNMMDFFPPLSTQE
jgi:hypothetical protein